MNGPASLSATICAIMGFAVAVPDVLAIVFACLVLYSFGLMLLILQFRRQGQWLLWISVAALAAIFLSVHWWRY